MNNTLGKTMVLSVGFLNSPGLKFPKCVCSKDLHPIICMYTYIYMYMAQELSIL